ncbi:MAG: hypothetical protein NWR69_09895 [Flavobacteriales bacterium]|nr:hypothetical protein [Flavobacteriales bacterium]
MKNLLILPLFIVLSISTSAQTFGKSKIILQGKVTELFLSDSTEKPLDKVSVQIWSEGKLVSEIKTAHRGKYRMEAPYKQVYQIKYVHDGYVTKTVELETKSIKREESAIRLMLTIDISLFKENSACDFSFLNEMPVAKAKVLRRKDNISWDLDYNKTIQDRVRKEISKARVAKSVL